MLGKALILNDLIHKIFQDKKMKTVTFQVTEDCCLNCTYCYQLNKSKEKMSFETAKKFIDYIFQEKDNPNSFFSKETTSGLIIEFIGGEPLMEIDLIEQIIEYFENYFKNNPQLSWSVYHNYSISSNGVLYFNDKFQNMLKKYGNLISISVTVDGCKECHDACRIFHNGEGSYDKAFSAAKHYLTNYNGDNTKITLSPQNISYLYQSVINLISEGFTRINVNFVYEEGWTFEDAQICYNELIKIGKWIINNNLYDHVYCSLLDYRGVLHKNITNENWCGANSAMIAIDYKGDLFPCIRFMESSLNGQQKPFSIGNLENGIGNKKEHINNINILNNLNDNLKYPEKCLTCTFNQGCSWCCGYNYQATGDLGQKTTFICDMHKARAVATYDFLCMIDEDKTKLLNIPFEIRTLFRKEE